MSRARRNALTVSVSALALLTLAACGSKTDGTDDTTSHGASHVKVSLAKSGSGDACQVDNTSVAAGPVTFEITNTSATSVNEVEILSGEQIVGEKENLYPGLASVSLTLTLPGGDYAVYCPGATTEKVPFKVTGSGAAASAPTGSAAQLLQKGATSYGDYVTSQVDAMVTAVEKLQTDVDSGDLPAAQKQYGIARPFYEKIESDVEGFVLPGHSATDNAANLDYLIDMRASNLDPSVGWSGFHAVERDLFGRKKITAATKKYAADLARNVKTLARLSSTLTYKPEDLANGAAGLLEEVQGSKISGEEESFSHIDLVDFAANVEGAQQAFAALEPGLKQLDAGQTAVIAKRFAAVDAKLDSYRDPKAVGGYRTYTPALRASDARVLSQTVQALQDALANLAEKVATA